MSDIHTGLKGVLLSAAEYVVAFINALIYSYLVGEWLKK